jgi:hypothetical protein
MIAVAVANATNEALRINSPAADFRIVQTLVRLPARFAARMACVSKGVT